MLQQLGTKINRILKADMVKVFSLTSISTLVRMLTGFVSIKVVALLVGPEGIAVMGQLSNFTTIALAAATLGINNGITKYVAEYKDDKPVLSLFISTAYKITLWGSLACGAVMIALCRPLSEWILHDGQWWYVFVIFGLTIIFYTMNGLLMSIVNGTKDFRKFVWVNIIGSIVGLVFTLVFVYTMQLDGALISIVTYQSVIFFVTLWMVRHEFWFRSSFFRAKPDRETLRKYLHYTVMTLVSVALLPVSQMILRGYVMTNISETEAGWWEAMNRLSNVYLTVILSSFSIYYLPRLSELKSASELRHEITNAYKFLVPAMLVGFTAIYFLRDFLIWLLFSPEFIPVRDLFAWQLAGDFFKIASWLLAFLMVAKSRTAAFVSTEIIFSLSFLGLAFFMLNKNGIVGLTQAYMLNYIAYTITMAVLFRKVLTAK